MKLNSAHVALGGTALAALTMFLSACSFSPAQVQVACQQDAIIQPIAAAVVDGLVPASDPIVAVDSGLIHPAIQAYCKAQGGTAVVVSSAAAPVVAPVVAPVAPVVAPVAPVVAPVSK